MWTCSKCGSNVGEQFSACQSCGTGADGSPAPAPPTVDTLDVPVRVEALLRPPPELRAVESPPPSLQERMVEGAKTGALYGAIYGAGFILIFWSLMFVAMRGQITHANGPAAALGEGLLKGVLIGAAIGALIFALYRLAVPPKPPKGP